MSCHSNLIAFFDRLTKSVDMQYICILVKYEHAFEKLTERIHIHLNVIALTGKKKNPNHWMKDN